MPSVAVTFWTSELLCSNLGRNTSNPKRSFIMVVLNQPRRVEKALRLVHWRDLLSLNFAHRVLNLMKHDVSVTGCASVFRQDSQ